jgi:hypothetical protein
MVSSIKQALTVINRRGFKAAGQALGKAQQLRQSIAQFASDAATG